MKSNKRAIVIFSNLPWNSQILHRSHELAGAFAELGHKVYFVQRTLLKKSFSTAQGITVIGLGALPLFRGRLPIVYLFNGLMLKRKITNLIRKIESPVIYVMHPNWVDCLPKNLDYTFDISDEYYLLAKNSGWSSLLKKMTERSIGGAKKIVVTSAYLQEGIPRKKPVKVVTNGVSLSAFEKCLPVLKGERPRVGFIGGVYEWVDLGLINKTAIAIPEAEFVVVGPTNRKAEIERTFNARNLRYLGGVDRERIGNYFCSLQVGLVPFVNEKRHPRLKTVNSNKIYQYAYFGVPIVSTDYEEARQLRDLIFVAKSEAEFIEQVRLALKEKNNPALKKYALDNTWNKKAKEILEFIEGSI